MIAENSRMTLDDGVKRPGCACPGTIARGQARKALLEGDGLAGKIARQRCSAPADLPDPAPAPGVAVSA